MASIHDLFPTILDFADVSLPTDRIFDGYSLVPILTGKNQTSPYTFYYYYRESFLMAVRYGPWKCNFYTRSGFEADPPIFHNPCLLYQLEWNPAENIELNSTLYSDILNIINQEYNHQVNTLVKSEPQYNALQNSTMPCCNGVVTDQAITDAQALGYFSFALWQYLGCLC